MKIHNKCVLEHIQTMPDKSVNTTFSDIPYALGTVWHYVNGILQMKNGGKDFMGAWGVNNANWWREYFTEVYRVMKYGGYVCFYNIDRQAFAFQTLMVEAGFTVCQTMYWANIGNFPKASDASKNIDKYFGAEREVVGKHKSPAGSKGNTFPLKQECNITSAATDLAKQFENNKYGIAPLKKITEPLLVFRKEPKSKSVLHDLIAFRNDDEISPAVLDIENARVAIDLNDKNLRSNSKNHNHKGDTGFLQGEYYKGNGAKATQDLGYHNSQGRFPATLILTPETAELLDSQLDLLNFELNGKLYQDVKRKDFEQILHNCIANNEFKDCKVLNVKREVLSSGDNKPHHKVNRELDIHGNYQSPNGVYGKYKPNITNTNGDSGYLSRVLHSLDYTQDDVNSFLSSQCSYELGVNEDTFYCPTVSPNERNLGMKQSKKKNSRPVGEAFGNGHIFLDSENESNNHPTLKPIALNKYMASLWKLPKGIQQTVYVPFSGSGSEIIGLIQAGYNANDIIACEINHDYIAIAEKRIAYYENLQPKNNDVINNLIVDKNRQNTLF